MLTSVIDIALYSSLACAGFVTGRWIGARYEPGVAHYVMGGVLACAAVYVLAAPQVSLNPHCVSLIAGAYVGLSLGSFLRILWREEHQEREREANISTWAELGGNSSGGIVTTSKAQFLSGDVLRNDSLRT
jgi:hypothetical protein